MRSTALRQLVPNVRPRTAIATEEGMKYYLPWWNTPVRILRGVACVTAGVLIAVLYGYQWLALALVRLLGVNTPRLQLVWPEEPEQSTTATAAPPRFHSIAGKKMLGNMYNLSDLGDDF